MHAPSVTLRIRRAIPILHKWPKPWSKLQQRKFTNNMLAPQTFTCTPCIISLPLLQRNASSSKEQKGHTQMKHSLNWSSLCTDYKGLVGDLSSGGRVQWVVGWVAKFEVKRSEGRWTEALRLSSTSCANWRRRSSRRAIFFLLTWLLFCADHLLTLLLCSAFQLSILSEVRLNFLRQVQQSCNMQT